MSSWREKARAFAAGGSAVIGATELQRLLVLHDQLPRLRGDMTVDEYYAIGRHDGDTASYPAASPAGSQAGAGDGAADSDGTHEY
jgi:hypothetical protein